jgi:hypothetical protein
MYKLWVEINVSKKKQEGYTKNTFLRGPRARISSIKIKFELRMLQNGAKKT